MEPCKNVRMQCRSFTWICVLLLFISSLPKISLAVPETTVPEGTKICLQLNTPISTSKNSEGDPFQAIVTDPVYIGERMVIPKGSVVAGSISRILRPGRFKGKAAMTLLFQTINIPGRGEMPIVASLTDVDRQAKKGISSEGTIEGSGSEGRDVTRVLTPGLVGAGIGTLAGGARGAGIGAGIGAAVGLATVFSSRGKDIEMKRGASLDITLDKPLSVPVEGEGTAARNR
jgi:hypothetical protein